MSVQRAFIVSVLLHAVTGCEVASGRAGLDVTPEDPEEVDAEVQRVFNDAACWCESFLMMPYEVVDTPPSLQAQRLYRVDVIPLNDPPLRRFVEATTTIREEIGDLRECHLSADAARGGLSDREWEADDVNENACTGYPIASIGHALCRADFDACLAHELGLAATSSTHPLPSAVKVAVRAESARRFQASAARSLAEHVRLRGTCLPSSTDPDCVRLATGFERAIYDRASEAASTAFTATHDLFESAREQADGLTPGGAEGTSYGAAVFGSESARVAMMQTLYGPTPVATENLSSPPSLPEMTGPSSMEIFPPSSFPPLLIGWESTQIRVLTERENFILTTPLALSGASAPTLPAGTAVNVHLVHFSPGPGSSLSRTGTITFEDRRVLGVLTSAAQILATHTTLGRSGTVYSTSASVGIEAGDTVIAGARSVSVDLAGSGASIDEIRIVTAASADRPDVAVAGERHGDLPYAGRLYGDIRTQRALGLLAEHHIAFPHSGCVDATTGEIAVDWDPDAHEAALDVFGALELAVGRSLHGPTWTPGSSSVLLEAYGLRSSDVVDAVDYALDADAVLDGLLLAPPSGCGPSILRPSPLRQRSILPLQAAFARGGTGALEGMSGTSWYTPSATQLRDVGTVGAAQILRMQLIHAGPTDPGAIAARDDTLALIDAEIGSSWTHWRVCEDASCDVDPRFTGRWVLFERTNMQRPAGVPVLVGSASDARCLVEGREPLAAPGATCAHVTSSASRYTVMAPQTIGMVGGPIEWCGSPLPPGAYCKRSFLLPDLRLAAPDDRRFVLWCARETTDPAGQCRSYELVDVIYTGAGPQVHAFGGDVGAAVAETFRVDPNDPAIPMFNSLGYARDFVPPLENELNDDDDALEDSYRSYLASAERAQIEATGKLAAARQHELEQLAYDRTVAAQLESAALAQQEIVSEICGADTAEADCSVPRVPRVRLGPQAGGVPGLEVFADPGPSPTFEFDGDDYDCPGLSEAVATPDGLRALLQAVGGVDQLLVLRALTQCARWQVVSVVAAAELRDLPTDVLDAVLETSRTGVPTGDFGHRGGKVRQQLISLYQNLEDLRAFARGLDSSVAVVLIEIDKLRNTYRSTENGWFEGGFGCFLKMAATTIVVWAAAVAAGIATGGAGAALVIAVVGAYASGALSMSAAADSCNDADLQRKNLVATATVEMIRGVEAIVGLGDHARRTLGEVASADAGFDDMAREVELARRRREIAERLATSGVAGDPTWRALLGVERRRADEALESAQRYAFVARRAIETRLALDMTTMTSPEPYVEAPSSWVNDVFLLDDAVDYVPVDGEVVAVDVRAEAMEDYVHSLGSFVDGYAFERRFSEGEDVQVVNLGEIQPFNPSAPDAIDPPFVSQVLFQCRNAPAPLPGGVPPNFVIPDPLDPPEPCGVFATPTGTIDLGGVAHATFAFAIPADLDRGYFGDRFAGGNFNYRIRSIALNLAGSAPFDCERAARPLECYADGNAQYSMRHEGETVLENWDGEQRRFAFEPGVITRARALADERWLTNPLSGADAGYLAPYTRDEWWGRPLAGTYTLVIEGRPEMEWRNLENVQVMFRYRYWTRQL